VDWTEAERAELEQALGRHPVESGRCAAVARVVVRVGRARDPGSSGRQVRPRDGSAARFVVPRQRLARRWGSHTYGKSHGHAVDALTGATGCEASRYLHDHWQFVDFLDVVDVDVELVDPGIEEQQ